MRLEEKQVVEIREILLHLGIDSSRWNEWMIDAASTPLKPVDITRNDKDRSLHYYATAAGRS